MKISGYLYIALALSFISVFPYKASSLEHIAFYATNNSGTELNVDCSGSWGRQSCGFLKSGCPISAGAVEQYFYSVDVNIFSPYGSWVCQLISNTIEPCLSGDPAICTCDTCTAFTLEKGDESVYVTFTENSITVSPNSDSDTSTTQARLAEESDTSTTQATLGDDNTKPKRDRDTWSIARAAKGQLIVITLEKDHAAGHSGEQATLILRNGGSTIETKTDALPVEITATLPSDGEYELVVQQHDIPEEVRFRGRYYLSVKSSLGNVQDIKPSEDVEQ
jgi:hypothetical protein